MPVPVAALTLVLATTDPARCNARLISTLQSQVQAYDKQRPGTDQAAIVKRFRDLDGVLHELDEERGVLDSVCSSDPQKAQYEGQLMAAAAWALALQSDLIPPLATCPAGGKSVQVAMVAQAWFDLATPANASGGPPTPDVIAVEPKVKERADALGLPLPALGDASAYWRTTVTEQAKQAAAANCPTPLP